MITVILLSLEIQSTNLEAIFTKPVADLLYNLDKDDKDLTGKINVYFQTLSWGDFSHWFSFIKWDSYTALFHKAMDFMVSP